MAKVIGVPRINALGKRGPEEMPDLVFDEINKEFDIIEVDNSDVEKSESQVFDCASENFPSEEGVCFVGGDHSITYPIFESFRRNYKNPFLIVMDAHADSMPPMKEPTHEEFLRAIIERGLDPKRVILLGVRKIEPEEKKFLDEKGVKVFGEIEDAEAVADYVTENANGHDVYFSLDIDVLDPAHAPGVNYQEVNGLTSKEFFYLVRRILRIKTLRAMDIVEAVPEKDEKYDYRTIKVCSKVVEEFLNRS
jgi:agmatinase